MLSSGPISRGPCFKIIHGKDPEQSLTVCFGWCRNLVLLAVELAVFATFQQSQTHQNSGNTNNGSAKALLTLFSVHRIAFPLAPGLHFFEDLSDQSPRLNISYMNPFHGGWGMGGTNGCSPGQRIRSSSEISSAQCFSWIFQCQKGATSHPF